MFSFILVIIFIAYGVYCLVQLRKEYKANKLKKQKSLDKIGGKNNGRSS